MLFECGPKCSCGPNCINRVSQRQLRYQLEVYYLCNQEAIAIHCQVALVSNWNIFFGQVYRVDNKGWAVRSWDFIPSGAPVCEYAGILRRNDELDNVSENDYIFDIDCWHTMKGIGGRKVLVSDHLRNWHFYVLSENLIRILNVRSIQFTSFLFSLSFIRSIALSAEFLTICCISTIWYFIVRRWDIFNLLVWIFILELVKYWNSMRLLELLRYSLDLWDDYEKSCDWLAKLLD